MEKVLRVIMVAFVGHWAFNPGLGGSVHASPFRQLPFEFEEYEEAALDWADSEDTSHTGSTALGFSVIMGGATYSHFDMSSDGYIELLKDANDVPVNYGYGSVDDLLHDILGGADPCSTYLLASYDDLSSLYNGYYGYKLFPSRAVFYYLTETYEDEDYGLLNNFELILDSEGRAQWNFNYADYSLWDYDLFSGIYFGNTRTLLRSVRHDIPEQSSFIYNNCADWLTADLNYDCRVTMADFGLFAEQWLKCGDLGDPNCVE